MLGVKETIVQAQAEGTLNEEVTTMEALSLNIMQLLGKHASLFKMVAESDPEQAYHKAGQALTLFLSFESVKEHHEMAQRLLKAYNNIDQIAEGIDTTAARRKAEMSLQLKQAANFLKNTGAFGVDTTAIVGLFAARMGAHAVKEGKWAGKEIKKSFMKRFF